MEIQTVTFEWEQIPRRCEPCYEDGVRTRAVKLASERPIASGQFDGYEFLCEDCADNCGLEFVYDIVFTDVNTGEWKAAVPEIRDAEMHWESED